LLICEPEFFSSIELANKRKKELMKDFNRDYDEMEIFQTDIQKYL